MQYGESMVFFKKKLTWISTDRVDFNEKYVGTFFHVFLNLMFEYCNNFDKCVSYNKNTKTEDESFWIETETTMNKIDNR
jgi:uncharacterized Fe-S cluster protein YjdI